MEKWQVQQAKSRLSELLERAETEGPQVITRYGEDYSVVMNIKTYREKFAPKTSIIEYLLNGPKGDDIEIERSKELGRQVDLFDE